MAHLPTASSSLSYTPLSTPSLPAPVSATSPTTASAGDDNDERTHGLACSLETFSFGSASSATAEAAVTAAVVEGKMSLPSFPAYCLPLAARDINAGGSDDEGASQRTTMSHAPLLSTPLSAGESPSSSRLVQPAGTPVVGQSSVSLPVLFLGLPPTSKLSLYPPHTELGCFEYPAWDDCEAESTDGPPFYRPSSLSPSATLSFPSGRRNSSALSAACYANLSPPTWSHVVAAASEAHIIAHRLSLSSSSASLAASAAWPPVRPAPTPQARPPLQGFLVHDDTRGRGSTSAPQLPTASGEGHQFVAASAPRLLDSSFDATTTIPRRPSAPLPSLTGTAGSLQRASSHHRSSLPLLFQHSHLHPARPHSSSSSLPSTSTTPTPTPTQHYFVPLTQEAPIPPSLMDHPALAKRRGSLPGQQATRPAVSPLLKRHRLSSDEGSGTPNTASHSRPSSTSPPPLEGEALVRAVVAEHGRRQQLRAAEESAAAATATAGVSRPRLESIVSAGSQESSGSSAGSGGKSNGGSSPLSGSSEAVGQDKKAVLAVSLLTAAKGVVAVSL